MTRPIKDGDRVTIYWVVSNKDETWTEELHCTVVSAPVATGDSWYVEESNGKIHMINHRASNFLEMVKEP